MHHEIPSKEEVGWEPPHLKRPFCLQVTAKSSFQSDWKPITKANLLAPTGKSEGPEEEADHAQLSSQCKIHTQQEKTPLSCPQSLFPAQFPPYPTPHIPGGLKLHTFYPCLLLQLFFSLLSIPILSCVSAAQEYRFPPL